MTRTLCVGLVAIAVAFVMVPILGIFTRTTSNALGTALASEALRLSLGTTLVALAIIVAFGTPLAYLLATLDIRGRRLVETVVELPIVMPPVVAGIALLSAFGSRGTIGGPLGLEIPFTTTAVVIALVFVASPFYVRQAQAAFAAVDPRLREEARIAGAGPMRILLQIDVPVARAGLVAGAELAWARALGEFGATIVFAGSLEGVTQTAPLAIYALLDVDRPQAFALATVLVVVAAAVLVAAKLGGPSAATGR